ncbi:competence damage-inducible protein A [Amylibacter marinus]|uniref:Competence damage-inducible protein A n=1 Tax=Amylibacter marinus TaxID=1475483 RepID=A0ABQ5VSC6_9RHOB|nr:CinA family protein [Amylibacter marinus]GLQ34328.1 competence damage-inducible protein A [Amylibacter marinus]
MMDLTPEELLEAARGAGIRIATAESCTGGMISAALTDIAGSSDVFDAGFVTYSNDAKHRMLGVSTKTLGHYGAVSEQVAQQMAMGALTKSNATIAVSVTGIAGPGGSEHKPEGRVCFGLAQISKPVISETVEFGALGRAGVRRATMTHALGLLASAISAE